MHACMHNIQDTLPNHNKVCIAISTALDMHVAVKYLCKLGMQLTVKVNLILKYIVPLRQIHF